MKETNKKNPLFNNPIAGYAYHRIILDNDGKPVDYEFIEVNSTFEKLTGLNADEIVGKRATTAIPGLDKSEFNWIDNFGKIALNGGEDEYEEYSKPLGKWYRVHVHSTEKYYFTTTFIDISESKKQAEELEAFFSVNLDLLCIADLDGNFIKTNKAWSNILGYSTDELHKRKFLDFVHPDDLGATLGAMANLGKGDDVLNFTNRYRCSDGSYRFIEWRSHPKGNLIYAAARDVTRRVVAEKQILSDKLQIDMFFNQSLHGFFITMLDEPIEWNEHTDKEKMIEYVLDNQKMTRVNQAMLNQYGAKEEDFLGITVRELFKHDNELARKVLKELFDQGKWHGETHEKKLDGTPIVIEGDYVCLYNAEGLVTGHFGVQADITCDYLIREASTKFHHYQTGKVDYDDIAKQMQLISGAKYVVLNIFDENRDFTTKGLAGKGSLVEKVFSLLGFNISGKKWSRDPVREEKIKGQKTTLFQNLRALTGNTLPRGTVEAIEKAGNIGTTVIVKTTQDHVPLGDFTLIFEKGSGLQNQQATETFADITGMLIDRINTEQKVLESKNQFESLVNNIPGITFRCKADKYWTMLFMATQVDTITGYSSEELIGNAETSYGKLIHPDDQGMVKREVEAAITANTPWEIEYRVKHKDGSLKWVYEKGNAIKDEDGTVQYLDGFILDISAKKKAELYAEQLQHTSERQRKAFDQIAQAIAIHDDSSAILEAVCKQIGQALFADRALVYDVDFEKEIIHGLSEWLNPEVPNLTPSLGTYPLSVFKSGMSEIRRTKQGLVSNHSIPHPTLCKDGSDKVLHRDMSIKTLCWVPFQFTHKGFQLMVFNWVAKTTSLEKEDHDYLQSIARLVELALNKIQVIEESQTKQKRIQFVYDIMGEGFYTLNEHGVITQINQAACKTLGYKAEELIGQVGHDLFHSHDSNQELPLSQCPIFKTIEKGETYSGIETFRHKSGKMVDVKVVSAPFLEADGTRNSVTSFSDITQQKKSEEENRRLQQQLQMVMNNYPDGIIALYDKEFKYHLLEGRGLSGTGLSKEDIVGKKIRDVFPNKFSELLEEKVEKAFNGVQETFEISLDGRIFSETVLPVQNEGGVIEFVLGVIQDITDRKLAEEKLKVSEDRYNRALSGAGAGLWDWNMVNNTVYFSEQWKKMLGYEYHEIPNEFSGWRNLWHPDEVSSIEQKINDHLEGKSQIYEVEHRLRAKDGTWRWILTRGEIEKNSSGQPIRWTGTNVDLTERKEIEQKLIEERSLLRTIIDSSPDSIYVKDVDGRKVIANRVDCEYSGVEHEYEIIGKTDFDLYPEEKARETSKIDEEVLVKGQDILNHEEVIHDSNGDKIWLLTSKIPLRNRNGEISGLVGIGRNITDRKKADEVREELLNRLERIGDEVPGIIYQYKLYPDGSSCFPYASKGIKDIYGVSPEQVKTDATPVFKVLHPDDLEQVSLSIKESAEQLTIWNVTYRVNHPSGYTIWVEGNATPQKEADGSILWHGFIYDITDRKKAESKLQYNENLLDALYELSPIGIALNDYETGIFIDVNKKLLEPSGYTKEEFLNLSYFDITPVEYFKKEEESLNKLEIAGRYGPFEKEVFRKDGSMYPVLMNGILVKDLNGRKLIWSFIEDISIKKETEQKLYDALNSLQGILDASTQVSIIAIDQQGVITHFNQGAERMLGYNADEVVGKETLELIHLDEEIAHRGETLSKELGRNIRGLDVFTEQAKQGTATTTNWKYIRKDGSTYPILLSVTAIYREKEIVGYLGVAVDITPLEKAKQELNLLLDISQKQNDRLKNFAHIVTHNLRSHSGGLYGLLNLIEMEHPDIYENEYVQLFKKSAVSLQETIEHLTDIVNQSFAGNDDYSEVNIREAVDRNRNSIITLSNKNNVKIINDIDEKLHLSLIPAYFDSIIMNFLTNGIKYSDPDKDSYVRIYADTKDNKFTVLIFEDNGLGIDLDKYGDKLFGMHNTFHKHDDSRGVGLYITKNQVESMGGHIAVDSKVGIGTNFKVHLPKSAR